MPRLRILFCCVLNIFFYGKLFAQDQGASISDKKETKKEKNVKIIPLPVIAANPTTSLLFGVLPGVNWNFGSEEDTKNSAVLGGFYYTLYNQVFTSIRGNAFTKENKWNLMLDLRFNLNKQPTYGLGTRPNFSDYTLTIDNEIVSDNPYDPVLERELMRFTHFRFYQTVMRKISKRDLYAGIGYHLDVIWDIDDQQLNLANGDTTFHYAYQKAIGVSPESYTQSGLSANVLWDSRDNIVNPYSGYYAFASFRAFPEALGSTTNASQLWLEYRNYFNLDKNRPRNLLAFWAFGWFVTGGNSSYMFLPATGWDMFARSARPYTQGRFRGEDLVYTELEWRFPLQKNKERWGGVAFFNASTASNRIEDVPLMDYFKLGYGGGLRFMLDEKKRVNLGLDYGFGFNGAQAIFLNLNEYF